MPKKSQPTLDRPRFEVLTEAIDPETTIWVVRENNAAQDEFIVYSQAQAEICAFALIAVAAGGRLMAEMNPPAQSTSDFRVYDGPNLEALADEARP